MQTAELIQKANEMFAWYEVKRFEGFSNNFEKVLGFCDYVNRKADWELMDDLETSETGDVENFRALVNNGIDIWLGSPIKTLCLQ